MNKGYTNMMKTFIYGGVCYNFMYRSSRWSVIGKISQNFGKKLLGTYINNIVFIPPPWHWDMFENETRMINILVK